MRSMERLTERVRHARGELLETFPSDRDVRLWLAELMVLDFPFLRRCVFCAFRV